MISLGARAWFFYAMLNVLILAMAWWAADRVGLIWIVPIVLSINLLILTYGQLLDFSKLDATPITGFDHWGLYKIVQPLALDLGIPAPQLYVMAVDTPQTVMHSRTQKTARLYLSEGLLNCLSPEELRAIVAQQLVAVKLQVGVSFYFLGALTDLLYRIGGLLDVSFGWIFGWSPQLSIWPLSPCVLLLQKIFLPKNIYLQIDKMTAQVLQNPEILAQTLWKLESYAKTKPMMPPNIYPWSHMCAVSPLRDRRPLNWLKTQPDMKIRIKNLVGYFPI